MRTLLLVSCVACFALPAGSGCSGSDDAGSCVTQQDCPRGSTCLDGRCVPRGDADVQADADAPAEDATPEDAVDTPGDPGTEADDADGAFDDEGPEDVAEEETTEPVPVGTLVAIQEATAESIASLVANTGYATVYALDVPAEPGDVLRVRGQIEMTNDYAEPVRGHIRLLADGAAVGSSASQNCIASGGHHMPLWADAVVVAAGGSPVRIEAQYAAGRSGASPSVRIEPGYGHVVVEQYRRFASVETAAAAGGRVLAETAQDRAADSSTFGTDGAFVRTVVYSLSLSTLEGDAVRLFGQATSQWTGAGLDMHGQGLFDGDMRLSPWSTENFPWAIQSVPLWTDAVDERPAGVRSYGVSMHDVLGLGGIVVAGAGQLAALRFERLVVPAAPGTWEWSESSSIAGSPSDGGIVANSGWQTALDSPIVAGSGDVLRVTGAVQLAYPAGFALGISCIARTDLVDAAGSVVDSSPSSPKYITQDLEVLPLRNELFTTIGPAGGATVRMQLVCTREAASPTVTIVGGGTWLFVDRYRPLSP